MPTNTRAHWLSLTLATAALLAGCSSPARAPANTVNAAAQGAATESPGGAQAPRQGEKWHALPPPQLVQPEPLPPANERTP